MEAQACWLLEFTVNTGLFFTKTHVTNDSTGRRYKFTVDASNNGKLKFRTTLARADEGYKCKEEVKLNWEYKLDASITTADGTAMGECAGKWSGVFLDNPKKSRDMFDPQEAIENVIEMEDPVVDRVYTSHYRGDRQQVFILKMNYQLKVVESVEKKIPVEKAVTVPPQTIIVQKTSPCLDHLIKKQHSDVVIKCGSSQLDAHKLVLSCCSPVFSRMFASQLDEAISNCVTIDDFEVETMKDMISFMYEGKIASSSKNSLVALLDCAEKYEISELKVFVLEKMVASLSTENALEFAGASTKYGADENTKAKLFEYCKSNFQSLSTNEEFKKFFKENVDLFL